MPPESLLLADATLIRNFTQAGRPCTEALLRWAMDDLQFVHEVHEELKRHRAKLPALDWFLEQIPEGQIHALNLDEIKTTGQIVKALAEPGDHEDANIGEVATVIYAERRMAFGEHLCVVTDDQMGRRLAQDRDIPVVGTPAIVKQMVSSGELSVPDGARIGREHFSNPARQQSFHESLRSLDTPTRAAK